MHSRAARLMAPTRKTEKAVSKATPIATVRRTNRGAMCRRRAITMPSTPRNDPMIPEAARSCRNGLAFRGMSPTQSMCTPTETSSTYSVRDGRVRSSAWSMRRSAWTRVANTAMRIPVITSVALKMCPEKSSAVPSSLKCSCHHSVARVVVMESRVPPERTAAMAAARRGGVAISVSEVISARGARGATWTADPPGPRPLHHLASAGFDLRLPSTTAEAITSI